MYEEPQTREWDNKIKSPSPGHEICAVFINKCNKLKLKRYSEGELR
jgi:hypothetical protein